MIDDPEIGLLRKHIDQIDRKLLDLLAERLDIVRRVGEEKRKKGLAVVDPTREEALLKGLIDAAPASLDEQAIRAIFAAIVTQSRRLQEQSSE